MMPTLSRVGKRERPSRSWFYDTFDNLRCRLNWADVLTGVVLCVVIAVLLTGFRFQRVPDYGRGTIAAHEVRAPQNVVYEDVEATEERRAAAMAAVPAVYELDWQMIDAREQDVARYFSAARALLVERGVPATGPISRDKEAGILAELESLGGGSVAPAALPALLKHRFSAALEGQLVRTLDTVLRGGIVADKSRFLKDQQAGVILRDSISPVERPLAEGYRVRNVQDAQAHLSQFALEFYTLPPQDRERVLAYLRGLLAPTLLPREEESNRRRAAAASRISPVEVRISQGTVVVRSGEQVTPAIGKQLDALRNAQRPRSMARQAIGFLFFTVVLAYAVWRYFVFYQTRHRQIRNHTLLILLVLISVLLVVRLMTGLADFLSDRLAVDAFRDPLNLCYSIPFAAGAMLVTLLVDTAFGFFFAMTLSALVGLYYGDASMASYALLGSLTAIYSVRQYKDRAAIVKAGLTIGLVNILAVLAIGLLQQSPLTLPDFLPQAGFAYLGGILASAMVSMMLPALESLFKITTDIRLLELSNLNAPVLRRLSVEAPGTYHHSLMVGTLGEAAAEVIGANPLLVRVGAYYHDIGKMLKPEYFVENQVYGPNKHEGLSPNMSSLIIASHVKDGLALAKEFRLAPVIQEMIPQHHGTRVMTYFYHKAKGSAEGRNGEVVEADFRYPGPKPRSREAAIVMMADAVEAASRSLSDPTAAQIQGMIRRLNDAIVDDHQFDECDITLRDIRMVEESFFKTLTGLYHRRLEYPGYDFGESGNGAEKAPVQGAGVQPAKAV
jgi:putative nucleotidyltransferase with HDIG domain